MSGQPRPGHGLPLPPLDAPPEAPAPGSGDAKAEELPDGTRDGEEGPIVGGSPTKEESKGSASSLVGGAAQTKKPRGIPRSNSMGTGGAGMFGLFANRKIDPEELVTSEKHYLERLLSVDRLYFKPISDAAKSKKTQMLKPAETRLIFGNIPSLISFHARLFAELKRAVRQEQPKAAIAGILIKMAPFFRIYNAYYGDAEAALKTVASIKSKRFQEHAARMQADPEAAGMDLRAMLLLPIHRLPQYRDFVKNLLREAAPDDPALPTLRRAAECYRKLVGEVLSRFAQRQDARAQFERKMGSAAGGNAKGDDEAVLATAAAAVAAAGAAATIPKNHKRKLARGDSVEKKFSRSVSGDEDSENKISGKTADDKFVEQFSRTWRKARRVVYKDVPRLVGRVTVRGRQGVIFDLKGESSLEGKTNWGNVCKLIVAVAGCLETPQKQADLRKALEAETIMAQADIQPALETVFSEVLGVESKTFRVFRTTHQSILVPAMVKMAETVFGPIGQTFKDVNRKDGWQIHIYIGDAVYVTHVRKEQSLHSPDNPEHFECEWSLRLSFDKNLEDLHAVFVRIENVALHEDMPKESADKIMESLRGNGYLLS